MAKNRKKKGPKPIDHRLQPKTWKDKWRRVIRVLMIAVGALLLLVALGIPIANNAVALGVEKELKALPLPQDTQLVETSSVAGRLTDNGNGMQYFGALLVKSDLTASELQNYYDGFSANLVSEYCVVPYDGQDAAEDAVVRELPLTSDEKGEGYFIVYYEENTADRPLMDWLNLDMRGH